MRFLKKLDHVKNRGIPMLNNGIRTGKEYLAGLRDDREIWTKGKRVQDVTKDPGIRRGAETLAGFLDRQHDLKFQETVTYLDCLLYTSPSPRD